MFWLGGRDKETDEDGNAGMHASRHGRVRAMTAAGLLVLAKGWLWIGAAVAAVFLLWGIDRIDANARGAHVFRPLLVPGILLIWPLVLWRWVVLETGRDDWRARHRPPRAGHAAAAVALAFGLVVAIGLGLAARQHWPDHIAPERIAAPGDAR